MKIKTISKQEHNLVPLRTQFLLIKTLKVHSGSIGFIRPDSRKWCHWILFIALSWYLFRASISATSDFNKHFFIVLCFWASAVFSQECGDSCFSYSVSHFYEKHWINVYIFHFPKLMIFCLGWRVLTLDWCRSKYHTVWLLWIVWKIISW